MIVTCPACSTRYLVDPRALGSSGRTVRCRGCSHTWRQAPPPDLPGDVEPSAELRDDRLPPPRYPVPAVSRRRLPWAAIASVAVLLLVLCGVVGAVLARDDVVALWPPACHVFEVVGYSPAQPTDFEVSIDPPSRDESKGALIVEGKVVNGARAPRILYTLTMQFSDGAGNVVDRRILSLGDTRVIPGGQVPFRSVVQNPSPSAVNMIASVSGGC